MMAGADRRDRQPLVFLPHSWVEMRGFELLELPEANEDKQKDGNTITIILADFITGPFLL